MKAVEVLLLFEFLKRRAFLITWISLVIYIFCDTFEYYRNGRQFLRLRNILGLSVCVSRGTATVLNLSCALVLLPLCKKLNQIFYPVLSKLWSKLFFFWLEHAKGFHMTVGATIVLFSVIHSVSHIVNFWNFSRNYDDNFSEINLATHKYENPFSLLLTQPGITGMSMLLIILGMGATSFRTVRRKNFNMFWYTHHLYLLFLILLLLHPLSGVLKEEILQEEIDASQSDDFSFSNATYKPIFAPIKSKVGDRIIEVDSCVIDHSDRLVWKWITFPLTCYLLELLWRLISRNRSKVILQKVEYLAGRVINLTMISESLPFRCRPGQYILLQCPHISLLEWHPFTIVKVPTTSHDFSIWIRVKGDWTEDLEKLLREQVGGELKDLTILLDGPYSSPMEGVHSSEVAMCVAAGVGITPFVSVLHSLFQKPRQKYPGRVHLIWIVRYEEELTWLAELANNTILELTNANKPDKLNIVFYVTRRKQQATVEHIVNFNEKGIKHVIGNDDLEKITLLTPNMKRINRKLDVCKDKINVEYKISKDYPLLGCRLRQDRPQWDEILQYWIYLYPNHHLNLYCCGPKQLTSLLRKKCNELNRSTNTKFSFISEGFS